MFTFCFLVFFFLLFTVYFFINSFVFLQVPFSMHFSDRIEYENFAINFRGICTVLFLQVGHQSFVGKHKGKTCMRDIKQAKN